MGDEVKEMTEEEKAEFTSKWEGYVRTEVNTLLDIYLPNTVAGNIGIKYAHPVIERYENGTTKIDGSKAVGVNISLNFKFLKEIDTPKEEN